MELIRGLHNLTTPKTGCVATIGNFDGVHLGHQRILQHVAAKSRELGLPSVVITFDPQPQEYFRHGNVPPRLTRLREKILRMMYQGGLDYILCLQFNAELASMPASDFIKKIIVDKLDVKYLVVGDDFRFGHQRTGDFKLLQQQGQQHDITVVNTESFDLLGARVSSTRIRQLLRDGDLATTELLLGRPFGLSGRIAHGDKRGRIIGFPTANIYVHRDASPVLGVYVVEVFGIDANKPIQGVANVGNRPTVDGSRTLLEVHLFDFDRDIYGYHVRVDFLHKLRDEKKFDSFAQLQEQIFKDSEQARKFFADKKL